MKWVGRLFDRSVGWSVVRLIGRLVGRSVGRSVNRSVGQAVCWSIGRSVGRAVGRSVNRWVSWSIGSIGRSVGRAIGLSVGRSIAPLIGRPVGLNTLHVRIPSELVCRKTCAHGRFYIGPLFFSILFGGSLSMSPLGFALTTSCLQRQQELMTDQSSSHRITVRRSSRNCHRFDRIKVLHQSNLNDW